jgi:predicted nucleic acid-binding protein
MKTKLAFWDTSAIVPLCCFQAKSQELRQLCRKYEVVAWWASSIEAQSALKRLVNQNEISQTAYSQSIQRLEIQQNTWREILPSAKVRELAKDLIETKNLRTLDALQLASALVWCFEKPKGRIFVCCDNKLSEVAEKIGFTVLPAK